MDIKILIFQKQSSPNSEMIVVIECEMRKRLLALERLENVVLECWVNCSHDCWGCQDNSRNGVKRTTQQWPWDINDKERFSSWIAWAWVSCGQKGKDLESRKVDEKVKSFPTKLDIDPSDPWTAHTYSIPSHLFQCCHPHLPSRAFVQMAIS